MKQLLLLMLVVLTACTDSKSEQLEEAVVSRAVHKETPKRKYREITCPKCKGSGMQEVSTGEKIGFLIPSMGLSLLTDEEGCSRCQGTGIAKMPIPSDTIIEE